MSQPSVTVVLPVLNEEDHIEACLAAIAAQSYARILEIIVADGGSSDRTRDLASQFPRVRIVHNPDRLQAAGLNRALHLARGEVVVRVDGHCVIANDYVACCVDALERTGAALVGGAIAPVGAHGFSAVAAAAMRSPLGIGTARFHRPEAPPGFVDTVYLGAFRTATARLLGGFDATLVANEDAEFAHRISHYGGVWFDPAIRSTYRPRRTPAALARQFFRYGRGRAITTARHPASLSLRQLAAPGMLIALLTPWRSDIAVLYALVLFGALVGARRQPVRIALGVPVAVGVIHVAWGVGFLVSIPRALSRRLARVIGDKVIRLELADEVLGRR